MTGLPPLDLHAHVDTSIDSADLAELGAVVFAVTRSLDEARTALARDDKGTVWGVGCHPALASSHTGFDTDAFSSLLKHFAFVGEIGLDGKAKVPLARQQETLHQILQALQARPRIVSLHSAGATAAVLDALETTPVRGAVLHWWLGTDTLTARAVDAGCFFSLNASSVARHRRLLDGIPPDRLLTETDHPFGDRRTRPQRPGNVAPVEDAIASHHNITPMQTRQLLWDNLRCLVKQTDSEPLLPNAVRDLIMFRAPQYPTADPRLTPDIQDS